MALPSRFRLCWPRQAAPQPGALHRDAYPARQRKASGVPTIDEIPVLQIQRHRRVQPEERRQVAQTENRFGPGRQPAQLDLGGQPACDGRVYGRYEKLVGQAAHVHARVDDEPIIPPAQGREHREQQRPAAASVHVRCVYDEGHF